MPCHSIPPEGPRLSLCVLERGCKILCQNTLLRIGGQEETFLGPSLIVKINDFDLK
jgi:hypothetical protein